MHEKPTKGFIPEPAKMVRSFWDTNVDLHFLRAVSYIRYDVGTDKRLLEMITDQGLREIIELRLGEARLVGRREALDFARGGKTLSKLPLVEKLMGSNLCDILEEETGVENT